MKEKVEWLGKALEALRQYSLEEKVPHKNMGPQKIEVLLWLWENQSKLPSSAESVEALMKRSSTASSVSRSTVLSTIKALRSCGGLDKQAGVYALDKSVLKIDREKFAWLGKSLCSLVSYSKRKKSTYQIGAEKINFIYWLWENMENLPSSTRAMAYESGYSKDEGKTSTTVSSTLKGLMGKTVSKEDKRYELMK